MQHGAASSSTDAREPAPAGGNGAGDSESEAIRKPEDLSAAEASQELHDYLVEMKLGHRPLTARAVCTIAYLATRAGAGGAVTKLGLAPGQTSGNHARHFDRVVGLPDVLTERQSTALTIPAHVRGIGRTTTTYCGSFVFETLEEEISRAIDFDSKLKSTRANLAECYWQHPRVRDHPDATCVPLALYTDGISFQWDRKDCAIGWWIISLTTKTPRGGHRAQAAQLQVRLHGGWCIYFFVY